MFIPLSVKTTVGRVIMGWSMVNQIWSMQFFCSLIYRNIQRKKSTHESPKRLEALMDSKHGRPCCLIAYIPVSLYRNLNWPQKSNSFFETRIWTGGGNTDKGVKRNKRRNKQSFTECMEWCEAQVPWVVVFFPPAIATANQKWKCYIHFQDRKTTKNRKT